TSSDRAPTDSQGHFALSTERPDETRPYGILVKYWVEANGYALREALDQPRITHNQVIHLLPEVRFDGRVVDELGQPVAGATVQANVDRAAAALNGSDQITGGGNVISVRVRTDERGRFSVRGIPPTEKPVHVTVLHADYQAGRESRAAPTTPAEPL